MHARAIVRDFLSDACSGMHRTRAGAVVATVASALEGGPLTVTSLGRGLGGRAFEKHRIKRVDRLLSNRHLQSERTGLYTDLARRILAGASRPLISVDWSNLDLAKTRYVLRASVALEGRAFTLYEEVHPRCRFHKPKTERRFLNTLSAILGPAVRPIVLTDAGFHNPWLQSVVAMGWDFIGRVRGRVMLAGEHDDWEQARTLYPQATTKPKRLSKRRLSRHTPLSCRFVLVRQPRLGRHQFTRDGHPARSQHAKVQSRAQREPWLLTTSLDLSERGAPKRLVRAYRTRMQIEESFRDLKSERFGLGFDASRATSIERIEILLLIALLAFYVAWLIGACVEAAGLNRRYQANTLRNRRVLSRVYLGRRALRHETEPYPANQLTAAIVLLNTLAQNHADGF